MASWGEFVVTNPEAIVITAAPGVARVAEEIRVLAAEYTPVYEGTAPLSGGRAPGALRDAWEAEPLGPLRWRVHNDLPYAMTIEYGGVHNKGRPYAMLERALATVAAKGLVTRP